MTDDEDLYDRMLALGHYGRCEKAFVTDRFRDLRNMGLGIKYRANPLGVAMARAQLERLPGLNEKRRAWFGRLNGKLESVRGIHPQKTYPQAVRGGLLLYTGTIDTREIGAPVSVILKALVAEGVATTPAITPLRLRRDAPGALSTTSRSTTSAVPGATFLLTRESPTAGAICRSANAFMIQASGCPLPSIPAPRGWTRLPRLFQKWRITASASRRSLQTRLPEPDASSFLNPAPISANRWPRPRGRGTVPCDCASEFMDPIGDRLAVNATWTSPEGKGTRVVAFPDRPNIWIGPLSVDEIRRRYAARKPGGPRLGGRVSHRSGKVVRKARCVVLETIWHREPRGIYTCACPIHPFRVRYYSYFDWSPG